MDSNEKNNNEYLYKHIEYNEYLSDDYLDRFLLKFAKVKDINVAENKADDNKKSVERNINNKNPLDCSERELDWFYTQDGENSFREAIKHTDEMFDELEKTNMDYILSNYKNYPLYPCVYFSNLLNALGLRDSTLFILLSTYGMAVEKNQTHPFEGLAIRYLCDWSCDWVSSEQDDFDLSYPNIVTEEKNPLLGFMREYNKFSENHNIANITYVYSYVCKCMNKGIDVTHENWIFDEDSYLSDGIYSTGEEADIEEFIKKAKTLMEHKEVMGDK